MNVEKWDLAYEDYKNGMKYKDIADKYKVSVNTVKSWKTRKWGATSDEKVAHKTQKVAHKKKLQPVIKNDELTEQQKMFCLFYLQHFNATKAYQQAYQCAYSTAMSNGYSLLRNTEINKELHRLKAELQEETFLTVKDLVKEYIKQSFSDITDFTEFGQEMVTFDDGKERPVSFVRLKSSDEVDGSLIQEVKKGKDGVSIKLYDKQKAMAELMKYFNGDELRNAQITNLRAKAKEDDEFEELESDGFLEALEAKGEELWPEEE